MKTWDLLERKSLFTVYDTNSEEQNDAHHLAAMTALLGPPPSEFLQMSKETSKYWDQKGNDHNIGVVKIHGVLWARWLIL